MNNKGKERILVPMIVYLVRHGDAVPEEIDPARPLTAKGQAEVEATAHELKEEGVLIDEIWHSGKLRAKQTAEIIARVLNISNVIKKNGLNPNDSVAPIAKLIRQSNKTILIAGHLPFLGELALLFGKTEKIESGGVVRVEI